MTDKPRLIEFAFPLKQASLDSVHEKNVRHGHISTLHIWPARRPLAACRAALIATLLPDPGTPEKRRELCEKIGGRIVKQVERKKMPDGRIVEKEKEITEEGILHWGRETENRETLEWFRKEIRKAYGGRAPKVLDPFAGGGAIPLEAMRLGCEATAVDINPVAWFILKCTLEYPQRLAGKKHPLPSFILKDRAFLEAYFKAQGQTKVQIRQSIERLGLKSEDKQLTLGSASNMPDLEADLAWHVRAWGTWVLNEARKELAPFYPTYAEFEPLKGGQPKPYEKQALRLVPLNKNGTTDLEALNREFTEEYRSVKGNPRWVAKPTVAYLWARTVTCKNCRAVLPLLKTRWLCKKDKKRVLLTMEPNEEKTGVAFAVQDDVSQKGGNTAQRREHDKKLGAGTMSRTGARCPCCSAIMTMEDIRLEGKAGQLGSEMTAVVVEGQKGKEYRRPQDHEVEMAGKAKEKLEEVFAEIPFGIPKEPTPKGGSGASRAFSVDGYGFDEWGKLFTPRQLLSIGELVHATRNASNVIRELYPDPWTDALTCYLASTISRTSDYMGTLCVWEKGAEEIKHVFMRWALPITWDMAEANPLAPIERFYVGGMNSISGSIERLHRCTWVNTKSPIIQKESAIKKQSSEIDVIVTDPPYYDAIPYSDLMDYFYVWLRRTLYNYKNEYDHNFSTPLSPKWDHSVNDGELIDDSSRHEGDKVKSKQAYEDGMYRAFQACRDALKTNGRLVIVFAHKHPDAWETLVSAMIRAGFVVDGSWPIMTEMPGGIRNLGRASLSSSVWLVCKKRPEDARPGWDNKVLEEMRSSIQERLREFWDAGIRGPDFVWAATGPALESYSRHPVVKKANEVGVMTVGEFLSHVRRIVVDFVVGRVLAGSDEAGNLPADRLDEPTAYYLLHRHTFGLEEAPAGACILYAISCGISDRELSSTWDLVSFGKGKATTEESEEDADAEESPDTEERSGSKIKLRTWAQRKGRSMGYEAPGGRPVPLIDRVHRLMHLWRAGNLRKVNDYLDDHGLGRQEIFKQLLQSVLELSPHGSEERGLLETISNHIQAKGFTPEQQLKLTKTTTEEEV